MLKYTVYIGEEEVNINALEITQNKGEELDFGTLSIPAASYSVNYQILDTVKIYVNDGTNNLEYDEFVVISDKVERISKQEELYKHTVSFMEATHKLEKIIGMSIPITQPLDGTKLSMLDVVELIRNYVPFERTSLHASTRLFDIDTNLATYLSDIEAPQFFFNGYTIREMLNEIASYVNAIARLEDDNNLVFDFFNELFNEKNITEGITSRELQNQTKNFSTTVDATVANALSSDDENRAVIVHPSLDSWVSFRANNLKLEDTAYEIRLPFPIETLVSIELNTLIDDTTEVTIDITDQVYQKASWDRLAVESGEELEINRYTENYRSNSMYYEIGGSTISNGALSGIFDGINSIEALIKRALIREGYTYSQYTQLDLDQYRFRVKYVPYFNSKIRIEKSDINDVGVNTQIHLNQNARVVSSERLYKNLYGQVQRLGNDEIVIKKIDTDLSEIFNLGDYTNDSFVVAKSHIAYFLNYYIISYELTKNFNRFSNRIALNQENRQFDLPIGKETMKQDLVYTEYVEIDVNPTLNTSLVTPFGIETFGNTFSNNRGTKGTGSNKSVNVSMVYSSDMTDTAIGSGEGLFRQIVKSGGGNTLAFHWEFENVIKAGDQMVTDTYFDYGTSGVVGINVNKNVNYTDNDGKLDTFEMSFHNTYDAPSQASVNALPVATIPTFPLIGGHGREWYESSDSFTALKQPAGILGMTYQLLVVPHYQWTKTFVIGDKAIKNNNLLFELDPTEELFLWTSDNYEYDPLNNMYAVGTMYDNTEIRFGVTIETGDYSDYRVLIQADDTFLTGMKSWAIANAQGELYLAVNQTQYGGVLANVYLNFKNKRTNLNYRFDDLPLTYVYPPTSLYLTPDTTSIDATWVDQMSSSKFEVGIRNISTSGSWTQISEVLIEEASFTGLNAGDEYEVRVRAYFDGLWSAYTTANVYTTAPPDIPIGLYMSYPETPTDAIRLNWGDVDTETSYTIEYKLDADAWSSATSVPSGQDTTQKTFAPMTRNVIWNFRMFASNAYGDSDYSVEKEAILIDTPDDPTGFYATEITDSYIATEWDPVTNATDYEVRYRRTDDVDYPNNAYTYNLTGSGSVVAYTFSPLSDNVEYEMGVRALITVGDTTTNSEWVELYETTLETVNQTTTPTAFWVNTRETSSGIYEIDISVFNTDYDTSAQVWVEGSGITTTYWNSGAYLPSRTSTTETAVPYITTGGLLPYATYQVKVYAQGPSPYTQSDPFTVTVYIEP